MATYGWRKGRSVEEWLFEESYRFDFFQAVKLLQMIQENRAPIGDGSEPDKEALRIKSAVDLEFPASDVAKIDREPDGPVPTSITVNFLGLAGAHGPLPKPFTEMILERVREGDYALRDFLDIFNHRLLSLLFRSRRRYRLTLDNLPPGEDAFCGFLYSLAGLGTDGLRDQLKIKDRSMLRYTGLLAHQPRSLAGLEVLLSDHFQIPVKGTQLCGQWYQLDEDQQTSIGVSGRNQRLGVDSVVVGKRVWDQQGKFELALGPLTLKQFLDLLPLGSGFTPMCDLIKFYAGDQYDFSVRLKLKSSEVPPLKLSRHDGSRLSWTSWLREKGEKVGDEWQVTVTPGSSRPFPGSFTIEPFLDLPLAELWDLMEKMNTGALRANTIVLEENQQVDSLFIIQRGKVRITQKDAAGKQNTIAVMKRGDFFGEISPVDDRIKMSSYSVRTIDHCEFLTLSRQSLHDLIIRHPGLKNSLRRHYLDRLAEAESALPKTKPKMSGTDE